MKKVFPTSDKDLENIIENGLQSVELHIFNNAGRIPSGPKLYSSSIFKNALKISSLLIDNKEFNLNLGNDSIYLKKISIRVKVI